MSADRNKNHHDRIEREFSLERVSLIRGIYRALLQNNRTYAAFEPKYVMPLVERLASRKEIIDPMSGYGSLISFCSTTNEPVSAYCIEYNPPSYLWQVLINPSNATRIVELADRLTEIKNEWPVSSVRAMSSNDWFPSESLRLVMKIWSLCYEIAGTLSLKGKMRVEIPLAFLIPFIGRLSSCVQGNVVTHVKQGGLCIYEGWQQDFSAYLAVLKSRIIRKRDESKNTKHRSLLADCLTVKLPINKFSAMITSPPYPNSRDYAAMFAPENAFIAYLEDLGIVENFTLKGRLIGCPRVSETGDSHKRTLDDVKSPSARAFLNKLLSYKGLKKALDDEHSYYLPSFAKYFYELESAYENISHALSEDFEGYVIVINNTHRKQIIPVFQCVIETWQRLGFNAEVVTEYTRELSHVGGLNPRVKGLSARHTEYTIKVSRK
jgi:hypothetical protein